jgi:hypothetical protein
MSNEFRDIMKDIGKCIDAIDDVTISPGEIGDEAAIDEKVDYVKRKAAMMEAAKTRLRRMGSANEVFSGFARDAAALKVEEMIVAKSSADRQRAMETVLDRALGKAVDRSINLNVDVANMSDEELDEQIRRTRARVEGGEGEAAPLLLDETGDGGEGSA